MKIYIITVIIYHFIITKKEENLQNAKERKQNRYRRSNHWRIICNETTDKFVNN